MKSPRKIVREDMAQSEQLMGCTLPTKFFHFPSNAKILRNAGKFTVREKYNALYFTALHFTTACCQLCTTCCYEMQSRGNADP